MNSFPKDIYLYIANLVDDRTIINMLSTNKKFRDDQYFKTIFDKRYPWLKIFKLPQENWKSFYLKMIAYLAKLKENFDISYYPSSDFHPEILYNFLFNFQKGNNIRQNYIDRIKFNPKKQLVANTRARLKGDYLEIEALLPGQSLSDLIMEYKLPVNLNFRVFDIRINEKDTSLWADIYYWKTNTDFYVSESQAMNNFDLAIKNSYQNFRFTIRNLINNYWTPGITLENIITNYLKLVNTEEENYTVIEIYKDENIFHKLIASQTPIKIICFLDNPDFVGNIDYDNLPNGIKILYFHILKL